MCLARLSQETLPAALFPQPPVIRFAPERNVCHCDTRLIVQKTRRKMVFSMTGPFIAHETVFQCPVCFRIFVSEALLRLVPSRCNVAYDVLVFVGRALFHRYRTTQEVRAELSARNVRLSASEIEYLGRKFVTYLAMGHRQAMPRIRNWMTLSGGYILHLDATHDGDAPALMTGIDSLNKIVLANVKLPSEHADYIIPFLRKLLSDYGSPRACVHDMGKGIIKAVSEVFPGIRDFICHFHFLRDIGKDFLEPAYSLLRKRLRIHAMSSRLHTLVRETRQRLCEQKDDVSQFAKAIKTPEDIENTQLLPTASAYALSLWCLQGKHSGDGYGFPFDRPLLEFAERLLELNRLLSTALVGFSKKDRRTHQPLFELLREVSRAAEDSLLFRAVEDLRFRCDIFDRLRKAMRIAPPGGDKGLNDDGTAESISSIRQGVEKFRREIENDRRLTVDKLVHKMIKQIDKYGDKLFADPIEVDTPNGTMKIYPQRTNNILEQFFRGIRRGQRRKTGNDSMSRALQTMLADTPLVKNLDNPEYMEIFLNGKNNLEELFAELGSLPSVDASGSEEDSNRILPGFRRLINLPNFHEKIACLFSKLKIGFKSN
jgi:hypothetical protein